MVTYLDGQSLTRVGLFPLPNVVLLPHQLLLLHVFEPRYRKLVAHAIEEQRPIGVPRLLPGYEAEYDGNPQICPTFGVGAVLEHRKLSDGRYFILLRGQSRARLVREDITGPFRRADVETIVDSPESRDCSRLMVEVNSLGERLLAKAEPEVRKRLEQARQYAVDGDCAEYVLGDLLAAPDQRQALLESRHRAERLTLLMQFLGELTSDSPTDPQTLN